MCGRYPELGDTVNLFRRSYHVFRGDKWHFGSSVRDDDYTETKTYLAFTEYEVIRAIEDIVCIGSMDQIWTFDDDDDEIDGDAWDSYMVRIRHYKQ